MNRTGTVVDVSHLVNNDEIERQQFFDIPD